MRERMTEVQQHIQMIHPQAIVTRPRYYAEAQDKIIRAEVQQMIKDDIIELSISPFSSEVVLARKPNGEWRFCVDYRDINEELPQEASS